MALRTVFSDPYVLATLDPEAQLVRYMRTAVPFPELETVRAHHAAMAAAVAALTPAALALLIDVREAPPRNDQAFEDEMTRGVGGLLAVFKSHAFLVKTAVGSLQVRRLSATRGISTGATFSDEAAALKYLGIP